MDTPNRYRVTVSRINKSAHQDRHLTMEAHTVTLTSDGDLQIRGQDLGKSFALDLGDSVEIKTIPSLSLFEICRPCIPSPLVNGVRFVSFYSPHPRLRIFIEISRGRGDFLGFH